MKEDNSELHYYLNGLENLTQLLQVTQEIAAETGMQDWVMVHRGTRMLYNGQDAKVVISGLKDEEWYMEKNRCDSGLFS